MRPLVGQWAAALRLSCDAALDVVLCYAKVTKYLCNLWLKFTADAGRFRYSDPLRVAEGVSLGV